MKKKIISAIMLMVMALFCGVMAACGSKEPEGPVDDGKITITFIASGNVHGSYEGYPVSRITMPTTPSKTGYTFDAWYTEENGGGKKVTAVYLYNNTVTDDFNVYANFIPTSYSVSYFVDSAFGVAGDSVQNPTTYNVETDFALKSPTLTDDNARFIGWYSGSTKITNLKGRTGNLQLIARFATDAEQWSYDSNDNNYVFFGSYPQSEVKDTTLLDSLNGIIGTARPNNSNFNGWTAQENYANAEKTNIIFHKDVMFEGNEYRAIYFKKYRPMTAALPSSDVSTSSSYQDDNGYLINTVYWFKFEPIRWQILGEVDNKLTLFSDVILDSRENTLGSWPSDRRPTNASDRFYQNIDSGNWGLHYSTSRLWYADTFLYEAFNVCQNVYYMLSVSVVDDDEANVIPKHYAIVDIARGCKVYHLSREELDGSITMRSSLATSHKTKFTAEMRKKGYTDYAKAMGLHVEKDSLTASYWTRSHGEGTNSNQRVDANGEFVYEAQNTWNTSIGIAPAIVLYKCPSLPRG